MESNELKKFCFKLEIYSEDWGSLIYSEYEKKCFFAKNKKEAKALLEKELTENWFDLI